ncbi:MAG: hypothetical protein LBR22_03265 [Desulfovibrio sp.]|jgi:tetratricopeptide (TPR) repeat protein|nr:hypothetical protein [Desulfovibrio sp.]
MIEKIDLYKEVMELEPNSKLFFPLAKLMVEAGRADEAVVYLEEGLGRHPEFLEARLFFIDLLYRRGEHDACGRHLEKMGEMLSSYEGFWLAWASALASGMRLDTAAAMRFLAASLSRKGLTFHDVVNRGLEAILEEGVGSPGTAGAVVRKPSEGAGVPGEAAPVAKGQAPEPEAPEKPAQAPEAGPGDSEPPVAPPTVEAPETEEPSFPMEDALGSPTLPPQSPPDFPDAGDGSETSVAPSEVERPETEEHDFPMEDALESPKLPTQPAPDLDFTNGKGPGTSVAPPETEEPETEESVFPMEDALGSPTLPAQPAPDFLDAGDESGMTRPEPAPPITDASPPQEPRPAPGAAKGRKAGKTHEPDVSISVRTFSMAQTLESQGHLQEALDIYEELLATCDSDDRRAELEQRVNDLSARIQESRQAADDGAATPPKSPAAHQRRKKSPESHDSPEADASGTDKGTGPVINLRTRSMAQVLEDQGDLQGALDIYLELLGTSDSEDARAELERHVGALTARIHGHQPPPPPPPSAAPAADGKDALIGKLATLAERMEARAKG